MIVLGVWDGHDSGAAIVSDNRIAAAVNEERLTRRKLEIAFPELSIRECLRIAALAPGDIDVVAASTTDPAKALSRWWPATKEHFYQVRRRQRAPSPLNQWRRRAKYWITGLQPHPISAAISRRCLRRDVARAGVHGVPLVIYDHHHCHAVAAAAASGFDRAIVLTIDGVGDGASCTVGVLDDRRLTEIARTGARHSPGLFFEHITHLLNMRELEDEGKVMALASYAPSPRANPLTQMLTADGIRFHAEPAGWRLRSALRDVQWSSPNEQLARMAQDALEEAVVGVVSAAVERTGIRQVALAGGVASNIQVNRRLRMLPHVDEVFVFPHMGDGGLALGAALARLAQAGGIREVDLSGLALGPEYGEDDCRAALDAVGVDYVRPTSISEAVADQLAGNRIVMWFQGRMEYGPRALGHRSIVARPDDPSMRDRLNLAMKRRVWYQPFCPSLLESDARRLFCDWTGRPDRFMTMGYAIKGECRKALAAVVGVDGTCRPQIVRDDADGCWADLLRAMRARLGTGAVLNTSFNIHGEPLVCNPHQAVDVFRRSGADALACGPFLVTARL